MSRRKGIYFVTEASCLIPGSGAYIHIQAGLKELAKEFDIQLYSSGQPQVASRVTTQQSRVPRNIPFKKFLKGGYLLIKNNITFFRDYRNIKRLRPEFLFERAGYLSYKGLLIAWLLKIPHLYEVNGILWKDNEEYFSKKWNTIARTLESYLICKSDFIFFVGGVGEYYNMPKARMLSIQNGIESEFLEPFYNHEKTFSDGKIHIVFIGHAMPHHRLELFSEASKKIDNPNRFHIHLVGRSMIDYEKQFNPEIEVSHYGVLSHSEIQELLSQCHVGVIPYLRDYFSNVKAFMYAAAKVLIVMPLIGNFKNVFNENQITVFENESIDDFARALNSITHDMILEKGPMVFNLVETKYTWDKIFTQVIAQINIELEANVHDLPG